MNNKPSSEIEKISKDSKLIKENKVKIQTYVAFLIDTDVEWEIQPCDILQVMFTEKDYKELLECKKNREDEACFPIQTNEGEILIPVTAFHLAN